MIARSKTKTAKTTKKPANKGRVVAVTRQSSGKIVKKPALGKKKPIAPSKTSKTVAKPKKVDKRKAKPAAIKKPLRLTRAVKSKAKTAKKSVAKKPSSKKPVAKKPVAKKQIAISAAGKMLAAKKMAAKKLAAAKMAAKKIAAKNAAATKKLAAAQKLAAKELAAQKLLAKKIAAKALATKKLEAKKLAAQKQAVKELETQNRVAEKMAAQKIKADEAAAKKLAAETLKAEKIAAKKFAAETLKAENLEAKLKLAAAAKQVIPPRPIFNGPPTSPKIVAKIRSLQENREQRKDYAQPATSRSVLIPNSREADQPRDPNKDRLILMVRDPFWLHAVWDITRKSVERAKAALAGHWHTAKPILRLLKADDTGTTSNTENVYRDIEIHGGVRHWYIETDTPNSTFRLLLGYAFGSNRFHELARSNPVTTPVPGSPEATDDHWADLAKDAERVYAQSGGHEDDTAVDELQQIMQEKLKRPIGNPSLTQFGSGAEGSLRRMKNFHLELDAEMVVYGTTHPAALLTVAGEPVQVRSDGTFTARVPMPNNRQVFAATSKSRDGLDEQTIVLAIERNTKIMEPLSSAEADE
ncbi:MAG: DUF4912 domain-containing protein [Pirellulaceae bacterium]|nr:DUF4912 domain-containing protein [Pirellulaceae bacterium]